MNTLIKFGTPEEQAEAHHQLSELKLSFNDIERLHVSKDTITANTADDALSDIQKLLDRQLSSSTSSYITKKWPIPLLNPQENMDEDEEDLNNDSLADAESDGNMDHVTLSSSSICMSISTPPASLTSSLTPIQPPKRKIPSLPPGSTIMPSSKHHKQ